MQLDEVGKVLQELKKKESNSICACFSEGIYERDAKERLFWEREDFQKIADAVAETTFSYLYQFVDFETAKNASGTVIGTLDEKEIFARIDSEKRIVYLYAPVSEKWLKRKALVNKIYDETVSKIDIAGIGNYHGNAISAICEVLERLAYDFEKATIVEDPYASELTSDAHKVLLAENYSDWTNIYENVYVEFLVEYVEADKEVKVVYIITSEEY